MSSRYLCGAASLVSALMLSLSVADGRAQNAPPTNVAGIPVNYEEALVGTYSLPDPLLLADGRRVRDANAWNKKRRPEIVRLFEENQFGRSPGRPAEMSFEVFDKGTPALDGKAVRRQVTVYFSKEKTGPKMDLLIYLPAAARKPVPLLLNLSFTANSSAVDDSGVRAGEVWGRDRKRVAAPKGSTFGRLDPAPFLENGIGVATVYYGDIEPDFPGGAPKGVRGLYLKPGQTEPAPDEWGAIAAWGWGLSRALDYLESDKGVDAKRVAIFGASRLGKTVLWAGARDTRFALVIASGLIRRASSCRRSRRGRSTGCWAETTLAPSRCLRRVSPSCTRSATTCTKAGTGRFPPTGGYS